MQPREFVVEELENVERVLSDSLRYDYGPERSREYYGECVGRLTTIKKAIQAVDDSDTKSIYTYYSQLLRLSGYISLIERSHLGEFSWPFAGEIRKIASALLAEKDMQGVDVTPIIHVVAEPKDGYRIHYEAPVPSATGNRPFVVVAFPRSLKHQVLLHTIFGHEVGHTALNATKAGSILNLDVATALTNRGPFASEKALNEWLNSLSAPEEIRQLLSDQKKALGYSLALNDTVRKYWLVELLCDLFGLFLFGPGFVAAHGTLLRPLSPTFYSTFSGTHPPYSVRHKVLARALSILGWDRPITTNEDGQYFEAERAFLGRISEDKFDQWAAVFTDDQIDTAIKGLRRVFTEYPNLAYVPASAEILVRQMTCLTRGLPPLTATISDVGAPLLAKVPIAQTLYAGWAYWLGREHLKDGLPLTFVQTNRLSDYALLQQCAIDETLNQKSA